MEQTPHKVRVVSDSPDTPFRMCPICTTIQLGDGMISLVDPEDWTELHTWPWKAKKSRGGWYAFCKIRIHGKRYPRYMHRIIADAPKGFEVHHKNGCTLDNRKLNLQILTPAAHRTLSSALRISKLNSKKTEYLEPLPLIFRE